MNQSDFCQYISYYHDFVKFSPKIDDHHEKNVSNLQLKDLKKKKSSKFNFWNDEAVSTPVPA